MSTVVITYLDDRRISVILADDLFGVSNYICDPSDFNRQHNGVWNSAVMAFVKPLEIDEDSYPPYNDNSPIYYEFCQCCGAPSHGNTYCGPSCEFTDMGGVLDQGWPV